MARNPQGFGGDWQVRSSCPGGVGLDDWTAPAGQEPKGASTLTFQISKTQGSMNRNRNRHRHRHRHRQRIITDRKNLTHWPDKTVERYT